MASLDTPRDASPLLADLNPPQRDAVTHGGGPLLILAGPGSGKTRVITRRIAWLIREAGVRPWEVLAITFTNKAAKEMRERVEKLLPTEGLWIGTFHSVCARILRRDIGVLPGYTRDFSIYDTHDKNQLLKTLIKDANYDATRFKPSQVGAWISRGKNKSRAAAALDSESDGGDGIEHEVLTKIEKLYAAALVQNNALDFDDLLLLVLRIFDEHPGVRDAYARRFRYVLVDEYQDTNRAQYLLTRHFASFHGNLTVCGDPDQSIYGWRGADIRNILDFESDFGAPRVVKLEQNYRSTGTILKAAQALIQRNRARKEKDLWTEAADGARLAVVRCGDEDDEAEEIAREMRGLIAAGASPGDMAVFYRVNFQQRALETGLRLARIPYQVVGGLEFYERREVRDLVAYLRLIVNPADDVAFRRAVNTPQRGVGDKTIAELSAWAQDRRVSLMQAARSTEALARVRGRAKAGLASFADLALRLAPLADQDAALAIDQVLESIDLPAWLAEMDDESGVDRQANIDELRAHAAAYDRASAEIARTRRELVGDERGDSLEPPRLGGLRGFLQEIALVSDTDALEDGAPKVTLMTLHSAKGLEFPFVFLTGIEEELLPHSRALAEAGASEDAGVEEERRLLYVGITRARERLFLTHAATRQYFGEQSFRSPSRFLAEIPPELVEGAEPERDEETVLGKFEDSFDFAVGDRVEHAHFGTGTIERLVGSGVNARATVHFPQAGTRQLLLQYANLKRVGKAAR